MSADSEFLAAKRRHDVVILVASGLSLRDTARQLGIPLELAETEMQTALDEFDRAYPGIREETRQRSISRLRTMLQAIERDAGCIVDPGRSELLEQVRSRIGALERWENPCLAPATQH